MNTQKYLCIIADDFGMHPAVNTAIARAYSEGILTDTNLMPPAPAFKEAVRLTKALCIPVGLHATFTCDWDICTWGPLTDAPSFVTSTGRLKEFVEEAWKDAHEEDAWKELCAQFEAINSEGIPMTHVGQHMGFDTKNRFEKVMKQLIANEGLPYKGTPNAQLIFSQTHTWHSDISAYGPTVYSTAKSRLIERLNKLTPGYHVWVTHPAEDHASLDAICSPDYHSRLWARTFRAIDFHLLIDPEIADLIQANGIKLMPLENCPICINDNKNAIPAP